MDERDWRSSCAGLTSSASDQADVSTGLQCLPIFLSAYRGQRIWRVDLTSRFLPSGALKTGNATAIDGGDDLGAEMTSELSGDFIRTLAVW
jgi:hypothetical protein